MKTSLFDATKSFRGMSCLFGVLSLLLASCKDNGTGPIIQPTQSYYLYAGNCGYDQVYVIDTDDDSVVDTLHGFGSVWDVTATKSGKKLYVTTRQGPVNWPGAVYSVDPVTKSKKQILAKAADIYLEPNGTPIIIASTPYDTVRQVGTIDTVTDAISFFDTLNILDTGHNYESLVFDPVRKIFYSWTNRSHLFAYDYQSKKIIRYYNSVGFPLINMVISQDGKYIYFANGPVIDVARDSIVGEIPAYNESTLGSLALGMNGQYLYLTDPGKPFLLEPVPSGKIRIFQTSTNSPIGFIDVNNASGQANTMTDRIVISADGGKAYVSGNFLDIFVIDLAANSAVDVIKFEPRNVRIQSLALGLR
ncbi:MAG: hypothetical protein M1470_10185 [Bacteroidetes bacterium]|nr:hypothetical protein [Bacteroidota bacterium]